MRSEFCATLEFDVQDQGDVLRATVPTHRLDIQVGSSDLIEELAHVHGYDRLPATLLADRLPRQQTNLPIVFEERLRDLLVSCGLQEVITYALTMPEREAALVGTREYVRLKNPISSERVVMRQSVLASVLEVLAANLRHADDVRLFEIGFIYLPRPNEKLPQEPRRLAIVMTGNRRPEFWSDTTSGETAKQPLDFFDIKGVLEALTGDLHLPNLKYQSSEAPYLLPGRSAMLLVQNKAVGDFGQLHFKTAEVYGLGARPILVGEFDVEMLQSLVPASYQYTPVPRFPAALRDIAIVVPEAITPSVLPTKSVLPGATCCMGCASSISIVARALPRATRAWPTPSPIWPTAARSPTKKSTRPTRKSKIASSTS